MAKKRIDLLVLNSNETVTLDPGHDTGGLGIIDNGGVAIDHGRIVLAASTKLLEQKFRAGRTIDARDEIVLPGLVDPHTHLVFDGGREAEFQQRVAGIPYMEILRKGGGIIETTNRTRQASPELLFEEGRRRLNTCLESGSTTVEIKSGYGLREDAELKILRVIQSLRKAHPCRIVPTFLGAHAIPPGETSSEYLKKVTSNMLPKVAALKLAEFCDVFCENGAFNPAESTKVLEDAAKIGFNLKIHADQFSDSGGAIIANKLHATSADHLVHSPDHEIEAMSETNVTPVLLPASSHSQLKRDRANSSDMIANHLPVALGTDFSPSNWTLGQPTTAALAARELKMGTSDIIRGITLNAARALGLEKHIGSLEPGKHADLVTFRVPSHNWVGYTYGERIVDNVLIRGEVMVSNGTRVA